MKILIAPDSFKETLTAQEASKALQEGILEVLPQSMIKLLPLADGGEGTVAALVSATNGKYIPAKARDPLGRNINSFYGVSGDNKIAFIEIAAASGIHFIPKKERNPLETTTHGTGDLIKNALEKGYRHFIIGLGGSATNDGGAGLLNALGVEFSDKSGKEVIPKGGNLNTIQTINLSGLNPLIADAHFTIANDVNNPLTGENGASVVYGPQKGASNEVVRTLDRNILHWSKIMKLFTGRDVSEVPGSGAAGGLGAAFLAFFNATLTPGFKVISEISNLKEKVKDSDLIVTGEGKVDDQTLRGKTVSGVLKLARQYKKTIIIVGGVIDPSVDTLESEEGILLSTSKKAGTPEQAMKNPYYWLKETIKSIKDHPGLKKKDLTRKRSSPF